ncbi:cytochrome c biogenesis CcdA family protein [Microbacterium sp. SSW1-59]|uniref:cytochrome c biogenesis CcdA family protein n=1 Tax=Microbacterium xanthum TaxID=3079794 RepID=UPI002AD2A0DA|nr:cytochrome c biogenesis CcdA family protein [Microbacterium sp. SSW1-59]MDZ8200161.1 cytochrome c biogenesis CcdA family protein [Microbacterium sp. SSW1-59]
MWLAVPVALLAGLVSFLSPCVLPLVPGYLGFIGGAAAPRPAPAASTRQEVRRDADRGEGVDTAPAADSPVVTTPRGRLVLGVALFISGFTVVFMAVTILGGTLGLFFLQYADPITRVLGVVVIVLGLVFIGVFGFAQRTVHPQVRGNLGLIGAPLLGLAMGVGWTPCIGPTLAAIISVSWNLGDPVRAGILGLAYSLGLGLPFLLLAVGFGWATRSVAFLRRHIRTVNIIGGALLVALGVLMVTGIWTALMTRLQGVLVDVPLPL